MPPILASFLWFILLLALLRFDPAKDSRNSLALWVPLIWMFILGSRLPSQWLGGQTATVSQALEEGNLLDRTIFACLILLALGILISRSFNWGRFFAHNFFLTAFLLFTLISVFWSDFPLVALKRWFRDLGNYLVLLVVLSDPAPLEAVRALLRRFGYLLIPLCILLNKYYPGLSRQFDVWSGVGMYVGATTGKNLLGLAALLTALFFLWDTVARWPERKERKTKWIVRINLAFLAMSLWQVNTAKSTTCSICLAIGCLLILATHTKLFKRHPGLAKVLAPSLFVVYLILAFGFEMTGNLAMAVGKDPTLTNRTRIWAGVRAIHTNPIVGTGYESFWMGPRLETLWRMTGLWGINEAHNGYLEVYLNLGLIGLFLICGLLLASYMNICRRLKPFSNFASLSLALWTIMLFYCVTEAGFRSGLMWLVCLLVGIAVPAREADRVLSVVASGSAGPPIPSLMRP